MSNFIGVAPCRLVDTRDADRGALGTPALVGLATRDFAILSGHCNVPSGATAYSLNITVVPRGPFSYLTVWPTGQAQPLVSTLNAYSGAVASNAAIVPAGTSGQISVYVTGGTELIIDINGYFAPPSTQDIDSLTAEISKLESQAATLSATAAQSATLSQQAAQSNQIATLQQQLALLNTSVSQLPTSVTSQITQLQQQITALSASATQAGTLGQTLAQTAQQVTTLEQQFTSLNASVGQIPGLVTSTSQLLDRTRVDSVQQNIAFGTDTTLIGSQNSAIGIQALRLNSSGIANTALGFGSMSANTTGRNNVGIGVSALSSVQTGTSNIAVGFQAGSAIGDGSNVIEIGNVGQAGDQALIRIGTQGIQQTAAIAGVYLAPTDGTGVSVMVDENGTLGTFQSSRRYKEDIRDVGSTSEKLLNLRPVQFRYKKPSRKGDKPLQFGLIAEEVQSVFPELVIHDTQGRPETVQYHQLPALLLNELQKQQREIAHQQQIIDQQGRQIRDLIAKFDHPHSK